MSRKLTENVSTSVPKKELKLLVKQLKRGLSSYYQHEEGRNAHIINIRNVSNGTVDTRDIDIVQIKGETALNQSRVQPNDIILCVKGSLFKAALVPETCKNFVISSNLIAFTATQDILPDLLVAYLNSPAGQSALQAISAGIAQKAINMQSLMDIKIPVPPIETQKALARYYSTYNDYSYLVEREHELRKRITNSIIQNQMG